MSIGSWSPEGENTDNFSLSAADLEKMAALGESSSVEQLADNLTAEDIEKLLPAVKQDQSWWENQAQELSDSAMIGLIRFFTAAEEQLPSWEALEKSSVIPLNKILKKRGVKLDRDMLLWIRQHSSNRFLPNGAIL